MERNIAVIKIGYYTFAFEDAQSALSLIELISKAVRVDSDDYALRADAQYTYCLSKDPMEIDLRFIPSAKFNPNETAMEMRDRLACKKKEFKREEFQFKDMCFQPPPLEDGPATEDIL